MRTWNKCEVRNLEENVKQIEKEIDTVQGALMENPRTFSFKKKYLFISKA